VQRGTKVFRPSGNLRHLFRLTDREKRATPPVREELPLTADVSKNADAAGRNAHATMTFIAPARPSGSG
jgi:hypothetical protein